MPDGKLRFRFSRRFGLFATLSVVMALAVLGPTVASAWVLNQVQLDDGTCGQNLQRGSDITASASATPTFLLFGDGNHSSYAARIDGVSIGTFTSDVLANVCIRDAMRLADGAHTLTISELAPTPSNVLPSFPFKVDTVPPPPPSVPALASYSDSGVLGDNLTMFNNPALIGTAGPGQSVVLFDNGASGIGGALVDSTGHWTARTMPLANGSHSMAAAALDEAGNQSILSSVLPLRVDTTIPVTALSSPASGATVSGLVGVTANASDNLGVWKVALQVDGVTKSTDSASPFTFGWDSTTVANGSHTLRDVATDIAGNTASSTISVTVQNGGVTVPGAPVLGSAVAGNGSVALGWSAPLINGGSAVTGYRIYRATASGSETLFTTVGNVTGWTNTSVTNGVRYYYQVSAVNGVGEGGRSNELSAVPTAAVTVPGAPVLGSAVAGNGSVALGWSAPLSNGGSAVTGYRIYRATASGSETLFTTVGNVTGWTNTSVTNGVRYYYQVSAVNGVGEGGRSNELSAVPTAAVTVPGAPVLGSAVAGNGSVVLGWSAPLSNGGSAVTGYRIYRATASNGEVWRASVGTVTGWTDTSVTNGVRYYYQVSAVNGVGEGSPSNELSAVPTAAVTVPGAPVLGSAVAGNGSVVLGWSAPSNNGGSAVTGYRIYRATASGSETLFTTVGNVTGWTDTSVTNGVRYYYQVSAVNGVGEGGRSNELSASSIVDTTPPTVTRVVLANGGTAKTADGGDTVAITFSEPIKASTFCATWTDNTMTQVMTGLTLNLDDAGGNDVLTVTGTPCAGSTAFHLGTVTVGDFAAGGGGTAGTFGGSTIAWNPGARTLTITLGAPTSTKHLRTNAPLNQPTFTPAPGLTDLAGNALSASAFTDPSVSGW